MPLFTSAARCDDSDRRTNRQYFKVCGASPATTGRQKAESVNVQNFIWHVVNVSAEQM